MKQTEEKKFRPGPSVKMSLRSLMEPLLVLFNKAVSDLYPGLSFYISYSIPGGVFGYFKETELNAEELKKIRHYIRDFIKKNLRFEQQILPKEKVIRYFDMHNRPDILELLYSHTHDMDQGMHIIHLNGSGELFFNHIQEHYEKLERFQIFNYQKGFFLIADPDFYERVMPERLELSKYLRRFQESENSMKQLGIENLSQLNDVIERGELHEFIKIS